MVVGNEDHMVGVYGSKRSKTVADHGEESDEHEVDDVDDVELSPADFNPACTPLAQHSDGIAFKQSG